MTELFEQNGRWRGRMPFRWAKPVRDLLGQKRRTGEPSPALALTMLVFKYDRGHGKAKGSFTEKLRQAFREWQKGRAYQPITFEYRLSRKRRVTITGDSAYIKHDPCRGRGYKGFTLDIHVMSINGIRYRGPSRQPLALDRVIGRERLGLLGVGGSAHDR